jgi:hypothetical protein
MANGHDPNKAPPPPPPPPSPKPGGETGGIKPLDSDRPPQSLFRVAALGGGIGGFVGALIGALLACCFCISHHA